jgi:hypothetical protein
MLYRKLTVPYFSKIQEELINSTKLNTLEFKRYWDTAWQDFESLSPTLYKFINLRKKTAVRLCRFYLTPPHDLLPPHVDGVSTNRSPLGLNIPISGIENTKMIWYDNPEYNFNDGNYGFNNMPSSRVADITLINKINEAVIDVPTFVRTDVVHAVVNPTDDYRLLLSIRFNFNEKTGKNFDEVFDLADL